MAHPNARLTPATRLEMVLEVEAGWSQAEVARRPDHERIASGLGSGGAPRRLPVAPAVPAAEVRPTGPP